eukprot:SAG11_NODE_18778_length_481_cov_1.287958_1_plen_94_part_01
MLSIVVPGYPGTPILKILIYNPLRPLFSYAIAAAAAAAVRCRAGRPSETRSPRGGRTPRCRSYVDAEAAGTMLAAALWAAALSAVPPAPPASKL